jgi:hypothetical protein
LHLNTEHLPRQARDKHTQTQNKRDVVFWHDAQVMLVEQHGIDAASIASLDFHAAMTGYHEEVRPPPPSLKPQTTKNHTKTRSLRLIVLMGVTSIDFTQTSYGRH